MSFHNIIPSLCTANYVLPSLVWFPPLPCSAFLLPSLTSPCRVLSTPIPSSTVFPFPHMYSSALSSSDLHHPLLSQSSPLLHYSSNYNHITSCSILCRHPVPSWYLSCHHTHVYSIYLHTPCCLISLFSVLLSIHPCLSSLVPSDTTPVLIKP